VEDEIIKDEDKSRKSTKQINRELLSRRIQNCTKVPQGKVTNTVQLAKS